MKDIVIDLQKDGKNFAEAGCLTAPQGTYSLLNKDLEESFKNEMDTVYRYLFSRPLPVSEEANTFLLKYNSRGEFQKVFYPAVVRGCAENSQAPNPENLYIRWGQDFLELAYTAEQKGKKTVISFYNYDGEELDTTIVGYPFTSEKYLDPALKIDFFEGDDQYTIHLPIKTPYVQTEEGEEKPDWVAKLDAASKRGIEKFLELITEAKEYKPLPKALNPLELEERKVYAIDGIVDTTSKNGKQIVKLHLVEPIGEAEEIWCPFKLVNYIKSGPEITPENPQVIVLCGITEEANENTGVVYTVPQLAISYPGSEFLTIDMVGETVGEDLLAEIWQETTVNILEKFKYQPTLYARDLDLGVEYAVISHRVRAKEDKSQMHFLNVRNPETGKAFEIWCPNKIIPTFTRGMTVSAEKPGTLVVRDKFQKDGKTYAVSEFRPHPSLRTLKLDFMR